MKRNELIQLRELVKDEIKRRERIKELLRNKLVMEYLEITKTNPVDLDINDISEIIRNILSTFPITNTNDIYVCTGAWYSTYRICYEDTEYYSESVPIDSDYADYKTYRNIESNLSITADKEKDEYKKDSILISDFETNNIILNPYNVDSRLNGFWKVKMDFFQTAIKDGQAKAKKLVLEKYPRI